MPRHIFTYGSLMFPQVWQHVVRGNYRSAKATVDGYARYEIVAETYPAMTAQADAMVSGILYFDVDEQDIAILDAFEGADYRRQTVRTQSETGERYAADTFIYLDHSRVTTTSWIPDTFRLQQFLATYGNLPSVF
jgi:gamma-glutamylcyclotransferase (GGCT)/AIG2-like uncharacterized protein YtfP